MMHATLLPGSEISVPWEDLVHASGLFTHGSTTVNGPTWRSGSTQWTAVIKGREAWLKWDWDTLDNGTIAFRDTLGIASNIQVVDEMQRPFSPARRATLIATLAYQLPWQEPVTAAIEEAVFADR